MNHELVYLAAPYGHADAAVRAQRIKLFYSADVYLSNQGHHVVSPLYKVETAKHGQIPDTWDFWNEYSHVVLSRVDRMIVIMMPGWETSTGVTAEIKYCKANLIPITYLPVEMFE